MKFIKRHWGKILIGVIVLGLLCWNFIYAICNNPCCADQKSYILTAFSGWVSGFATLGVGIIAYKQSEKYKKENDIFVLKQYDYEVFRHIMDQRVQFVDKAKERISKFCEDYSYKKVTLWLAELQALNNEDCNRSVEDAKQVGYIQRFQDGCEIEYYDLKQFILNDWNKDENNQKLIEILDDYWYELDNFIKHIDYTKIPNDIEKMNGVLYVKLLNLIKTKNDYITWIDVDLNMVLTTKSGDLNYIRKHYGLEKENNNNG